jgi:hypothetical protein
VELLRLAAADVVEEGDKDTVAVALRDDAPVVVADTDTVALPVAVAVPDDEVEVFVLAVAEAVGDHEAVSVLLPVAVKELRELTVVVALPVSDAAAVVVPVVDAEAVAQAVAVAVPLLVADAVAVPLPVADAVAVADGVSLVITAFRTRWEPTPSVQYNVAGARPSTGTTARPMGCVRKANAPLPLAVPATPSWPTEVVTTPAGVTARIAELPLSATCHAPCALFHATPAGK